MRRRCHLLLQLQLLVLLLRLWHLSLLSLVQLLLVLCVLLQQHLHLRRLLLLLIGLLLTAKAHLLLLLLLLLLQFLKLPSCNQLGILSAKLLIFCLQTRSVWTNGENRQGTYHRRGLSPRQVFGFCGEVPVDLRRQLGELLDLRVIFEENGERRFTR